MSMFVFCRNAQAQLLIGLIRSGNRQPGWQAGHHAFDGERGCDFTDDIALIVL